MGEFYTKDLKQRHSEKIFQKAGKYCWETPDKFFQELNKEFKFTIDVCANEDNHKIDIYFSEEQDALKQEWKGICWMNPPYGRTIGKWVKKAFEESGGGATVVCLLPSRTETRWWWNYCMKGEIRFIKGRLKFKGRNTKGDLVNYPATFGNAIVIFRPPVKKTQA
jgi:phage N-6-adenine-methyltransferase